jgi:hypothetical protein
MEALDAIAISKGANGPSLIVAADNTIRFCAFAGSSTRKTSQSIREPMGLLYDAIL